jgi:hypothetical protein
MSCRQVIPAKAGIQGYYPELLKSYVVEMRSILFDFKADENFDRRHIVDISRIKIFI